jgi:hypothetical protein
MTSTTALGEVVTLSATLNCQVPIDTTGLVVVAGVDMGCYRFCADA